ncbi:MAG: hypothetical protein GWN85_30400, partial [Gemmatimonadetes bacterium]|nr:hypothetical protein [Gemmatimonadota bacterium]
MRARADSAGYRLRKFLRRNRVAVAAGSAVVIALVAATTFSVAQMREARRQRDVALAESRRNAALVNLQSVLAGDPRGPGGRILSMRERIALGAQVLERTYPHDPALVVEVMVDLSGRL